MFGHVRLDRDDDDRRAVGGLLDEFVRGDIGEVDGPTIRGELVLLGEDDQAVSRAPHHIGGDRDPVGTVPGRWNSLVGGVVAPFPMGRANLPGRERRTTEEQTDDDQGGVLRRGSRERPQQNRGNKRPNDRPSQDVDVSVFERQQPDTRGRRPEERTELDAV